mmetsp:Transcript_36649/g.82117  ORF Transcript_36649/g.82117 Transcript_36649/m.82117 type:complete len:331 (+) Transcript_36649:55-1047(+)
MARSVFAFIALSTADGFIGVSPLVRSRGASKLGAFDPVGDELPKDGSDFKILERATSSSSLVKSTKMLVRAPEPIPTPALLTIDPVGTLIQHREPMGMFFREVLFDYSGLRLPRPDIFHDAYKMVYAEKCEEMPFFGKEAEVSSAEWWRDVVTRTYLEVGVPDDLLEEYMPEVFPELHEKVFTGAEGWELTKDADFVLGEIASWQESLGPKAPKLACVSDFDERLPLLLEGLGIRHYFDAVVTSKESASFEDPAAPFDAALTKFALTDAKGAVHVSAKIEGDIDAACAAGWQAVFVKGPPFSIPEANPTAAVYQRVGDILRFLDILGVGC